MVKSCEKNMLKKCHNISRKVFTTQMDKEQSLDEILQGAKVLMMNSRRGSPIHKQLLHRSRRKHPPSDQSDTAHIYGEGGK